MSAAVRFEAYAGEQRHLPLIRALIEDDLSEPYSVFTYRYFLRQWPRLAFLAMEPAAAPEEFQGGGAPPSPSQQRCIGCVVSRLQSHGRLRRGYIAMLAVRSTHRRAGLGTRLVRQSIEAMARAGCDEVVLEAEVSNAGALRLYERLGFLRDKRLERYYLNGSDAFRLKLPLVATRAAVAVAAAASTTRGEEETEQQRR